MKGNEILQITINKENFEGEKTFLVFDLRVLSIGLKVYVGFKYVGKICEAMCKGSKSGLNKHMGVAQCMAYL